MSSLTEEIAKIEQWFQTPRYKGITRLHTARQVAEQRGTINDDHPVARETAAAFHKRLTEMFETKTSITTFGPYSPGQAVAIKRAGIEGIYIGGWATSAKGSVSEDPGADLASYPLSQVPDEAAPVVRALLAADKNEAFARARMSEEERKNAKVHDFRPFIIADADTGHGGDAHVRNLIRRFVEIGVPGYHIEDQKPGAKKCGHQGGKVLVSVNEQIKRLNAARFQLDVMGVEGIVVARTDAESATFIEDNSDERDHPFILGATNTALPSYKTGFLVVMRMFFDAGVEAVRGHLLFAISDVEQESARKWLATTNIPTAVETAVANIKKDGTGANVGTELDSVMEAYLEAWQTAAELKTYGEAVAEMIDFRVGEGETLPMTRDEWMNFAATASWFEAKDKANAMGITVTWDCELSRTTEGYFPVRPGIEYGVAKSLAVAPFADILWMETKTADLTDAKKFADAIHAVYPDQMLAYNLSPSFNWDTTDMDDDDMRAFPGELAKLGYVFNFITYGGHQIDGLAGENFAGALRENGMLALARLQRKFRLVESPYKTPQTLVGGPRLDAALGGSSGRTASTKAMGKGSTQFQHLIQTEVPTSLLQEWIGLWQRHYDLSLTMRAQLRPHSPGSDLLELRIQDDAQESVADLVFSPIVDRLGQTILLVRDQNIYSESLRKKRLMSLVHLFLIHRYDAAAVHYVSPTEDNRHQALSMGKQGLFQDVHEEVGRIIVATVDPGGIAKLLDPGHEALNALIAKTNS